jgi:hypothetical protein
LCRSAETLRTPGSSNERRHRHAVHARERREVAAHAGVDVEPHVALEREVGELADRIDHAVREARRRADQHERPARERRGHRADVRAEVLRDRNAHDAQAQIVRRLVERGVDGDRRDDLRAVRVDPAGARLVPARLHREHDALGAARGEVAARAVRRLQEREADPDDVLFHPLQARERAGSQRVLRLVERVGVLRDLEHVVAGVEDVDRGAGASPVDVALTQGDEPFAQRVPVGAAGRQLAARLGHRGTSVAQA